MTTPDNSSSREQTERSHIVESEWIGSFGSCAACGGRVSHYTCNRPLIVHRPEAEAEDYWAACDNEQCPNRYGEGFLQFDPDWEQTLPREEWERPQHSGRRDT